MLAYHRAGSASNYVHCSHKKIPSRNTVNIPGRDESILSPAVPPALSACLSIKKLRSSLLHVTYAHGTGLLFFRPDSSQVFPLPAPPNGALRRCRHIPVGLCKARVLFFAFFYLSIILAQVFFLCKEKFIVFYYLSEKFSEYTAKARSTFCSSCEV